MSSCAACQCVGIEQPKGDPTGGQQVLDVFLMLSPIVFLAATVMSQRLKLPTTTSLPVAALILFLIRLVYLGSDPLLLCSAVVAGILEALTPLSIMLGAMMLFETMQATGCLPFLLNQIELLTRQSRMAEINLIFAFAYLMEGCAGFGTPYAICVPMLIKMGYEAIPAIAAIVTVIPFGTTWGAVGAALWFGFAPIAAQEDNPEQLFREIAYKAAAGVGTACFALRVPILRLLLSWEEVRDNWKFALLSTMSTMLPTLALTPFTYEFPTMVGGTIGCIATGLMVHFRIGLKALDHSSEDDENDVEADPPSERHERKEDISLEEERQADAVDKQPTYENQAFESNGSYLLTLALRSIPLWGSLLLLTLTRTEAIGIKGLLQRRDSYIELRLGTLGTFRLSSSLVFELHDILKYPHMSWKYEFLYVPCLIPFVFMSIVTGLLYRKEMTISPLEITRCVWKRLVGPSKALFGALALVQLMIRGEGGGGSSPAALVGIALSDWFQEGFVIVCPLLGALGSFFSGSTTVSNLTFGEIQSFAAQNIGTSRSAMLALQVVGSTAGNSICLHNLISACTVAGLSHAEGDIMRKTYKFVLGYIAIATAVMLVFYFRFD